MNRSKKEYAGREHWPAWAHFLQQRRLAGLAANLSESAGPLAVIGAQLLYIGLPLLGWTMPNAHWNALAHLLEDQTELSQFALYLREVGSH